MDLKRDVRGAKFVVLGNVDRAYSYYGEDGEIYTDVTLRIEATLKKRGETPSSISFTTPGGEVGDVGVLFSTSPHFEEGAAVLVFLDEGSNGSFVATAKYEMNQSRIADFDLTQLEFLMQIRKELRELDQPIRDSEWERSVGFLSRSLLRAGRLSASGEITRNLGTPLRLNVNPFSANLISLGYIAGSGILGQTRVS